MFILFLVISLLAYWFIVQNKRNRELNEKLKNFPGTNAAYPILGDVHVWSITKWSIPEKIKHSVEMIRNYPTTFKVWFGPKVVIIINNPEDIKTILTSPHCTDKSSIYHMTIGGEGLFVANGDKWKNQRRHLNTAFGPRVLNLYANEFNRFGQNIVGALVGPAANGKAFNISSILGSYTTDLITRTIYGSTQHKFELSKHCYELVERLMVFWGERMLQIYMHIFLVGIRKLFGMSSQTKKLNIDLRNKLQPIFDQKVKEYRKTLEHLKKEGINDNLKWKDENFIEKLTRLKFEGTISLSEYRHTSMTMFLAGTETTARGISIIILMLAIYQEHQQIIYEEVANFFEVHSDGDIDLSKLSELNFLDRFIKETFRIFPIIPFFGRTPSRDIHITEGVIPAGTDILISAVNIHQQTDIWGENAMHFNPDNFLPEAVASRPRCSYLPFSYGPRNCIGSKFAQISMYVGVIYLLKSYQFKTVLKVKDIKVGYGLTTYIINENLVNVQARNFV